MLKQLFCWHRWQIELIFSNPPNTHMDVLSCIKCGKEKILFRGTRKAWREHHKLQ